MLEFAPNRACVEALDLWQRGLDNAHNAPASSTVDSGVGRYEMLLNYALDGSNMAGLPEFLPCDICPLRGIWEAIQQQKEPLLYLIVYNEALSDT